MFKGVVIVLVHIQHAQFTFHNIPIVIIIINKLCIHCKGGGPKFQVSFSFSLSNPSASSCNDPTQLLSNHRGGDFNQYQWQHRRLTPSNRLDRTS